MQYTYSCNASGHQLFLYFNADAAVLDMHIYVYRHDCCRTLNYIYIYTY